MNDDITHATLLFHLTVWFNKIDQTWDGQEVSPCQKISAYRSHWSSWSCCDKYMMIWDGGTSSCEE